MPVLIYTREMFRQGGKTVGLTGGKIVVMPEENLERMFAHDPYDYRFLHRSNIDGSTSFLPAGCFHLPLSRSYMTIRLNPTLFKWQLMTVSKVLF